MPIEEQQSVQGRKNVNMLTSRAFDKKRRAAAALKADPIISKL